MIWALFEIIIPLLLTFILGLIAGWLLWRWRRQRITASEWNTHTEAANVAEENLNSLRIKHEDAVQENSHLSATVKEMGDSLDSRSIELDDSMAKNVELENKYQQASARAADLDTANFKITQLEKDTAEKDASATELRRRLEQSKSSVVDLEARLSEAAKTESELARVRNSNSELAAQLDDANNRIVELEKIKLQNADLVKSLNAANEKLAAADKYRSRASELETQLSSATMRLGDFDKTQSEVTSLRARLQEVSDKASGSEQDRARILDLERQLEACKKRTNQLEQAQQNASVQPVRSTGSWVDTGEWKRGVTKLGTPGSNHRDDLKVIKGIGPEMEKLLNSFDIQSWEQLAVMTDQDVQKVDAALTDFPGRIERDEWVLQAQEIMDNGHVVPDAKPKKQQEPTAAKPAESGDWRSGTTHFGTPGSSHRDDLKEINGIGPVLEKTLNDFGIQSWEQLAELSNEEVDKIDQAIAFPGRIEREEWIAQAKTLVKQFPDRSKRP